MATHAPNRPMLAILIVLFLGCTAVGAAGGYVYDSVGVSQYGAYSLVLLGPPGGIDPDRYAADQIAVATAKDVVRTAETNAGVPLDGASLSLEVTQQRLSNVLQFATTAKSQEAAARLATAAAEAYLASPILHSRADGATGSAVILQEGTDTGRVGLSGFKVVLIGALCGLLAATVTSMTWRSRARGRPGQRAAHMRADGTAGDTPVTLASELAPINDTGSGDTTQRAEGSVSVGD